MWVRDSIARVSIFQGRLVSCEVVLFSLIGPATAKQA